ncbi:MAG: polyprenyl synthetase family protein [Desulfuromonadales bacterium]|nr:polyprenyl synthetase family protein [Desulfuromonadales bacterium]
MNKALALLRGDMEKVEAKFREHLESDVPLIRKVGEYVLASGGKRVRPLLLLLTAKMSGYQGTQHIDLASVVEFIHTATLLHDDVVDAASLRRGNASANTVWGNEASVLVGDFLFAKSFSVMVRSGDLRVLQILSDATTKMAEGEVLQLISTCDIDIAEERYMTVIRTKTAVLIAAACQCGGFLGGATPEQDDALRDFGMNLGVAFQLMDDALDYVAVEADFGKAHCHDLAEGKVTLPLIQVLRLCSEDERQAIATIVEREELEEADIATITALISHYQGIEYTRHRATELVERAKSCLTVFASCPAKDALYELADFVVQRSR